MFVWCDRVSETVGHVNKDWEVRRGLSPANSQLLIQKKIISNKKDKLCYKDRTKRFISLGARMRLFTRNVLSH